MSVSRLAFESEEEFIIKKTVIEESFTDQWGLFNFFFFLLHINNRSHKDTLSVSVQFHLIDNMNLILGLQNFKWFLFYDEVNPKELSLNILLKPEC